MRAAISEASNAVAVDPSNAGARQILAAALHEFGRKDEALQQAEKATELAPRNSFCHLQLTIILAAQDQMERATAEGRRAVEFGPENPLAYKLLLPCLLLSNRNDEAVNVAREAVTMFPFDADFHHTFGLAAAKNGDFVTGTNQFGYALLLRPKWDEPHAKLRLALSSLAGNPDGLKQARAAAAIAPDSAVLLNELGWLLATNPDVTLRSGPDALGLAERGCILTNRKMPELLDTLAAAYAETGKFAEATNIAEEALSLARSSRNATAVTLSQNLSKAFRANRPYRENPNYR
jgi:Flp pilus assembly protein TadD